jgi:uroporphyrin-III C-methyltransferase/precorrin-2 dehydrogenase/sirohydrochlorin ferrochelatase
VPVNVIDKPRYCQFQFGSIVNRSPVVVAISTDGAAPILAQAIRRRIETLLPPSLKSWARWRCRSGTRSMRRSAPLPRDAPSGRLSSIALLAEIPQPGRASADLLHQCRAHFCDGAIPVHRPRHARRRGTRRCGLLTLKAVRALQAADVILFDDLVSEEVLELARREAKRMLVGKRGGRTSCKQEDINATMIQLAKAGKHVVRLKSGDPMIFGRAGEEIACLEQHGIPSMSCPESPPPAPWPRASVCR